MSSKTLIPMAALDDMVGVAVFFTTDNTDSYIIADFKPLLGIAVIVAKKGFEWAGEMSDK